MTGRRLLPVTLTAGGKTRGITAHLQDQAPYRPELTPERLISVLENWVIRGIYTDKEGIQGIAYLGLVEYRGKLRLMQVGVSMDDQRICTAYLHRRALHNLRTGNRSYFERHFGNLETRDEA